MKNKKKSIIIVLVIIIIATIISLVFYTFVYGNVKSFQGRILEIDGNMITVESIEGNDSKFNGEYIFEVTNKTKLEIFEEEIESNISDLFQYQIVEITFQGNISKTNPAEIKNVSKLKVIFHSDSVQIIVWLDSATTKNEQEIIKEKIKNIAGVTSVKFKSKEEVRSELNNSSEKLSNILDNLGDNPFLDSYIVTIQGSDKKKEIIKIIEDIDKVNSVK